MLLALVISSLPVVFAMDMVTKDLLTPMKQYGEGCGFDSCPALTENTLNVHIVPHTHGELGYTGDFYTYFTGDFGDFQAKTPVNMKRVLDHTITELWADNERKFVLSDMAYFFYWWKQRDPTVHRMVYELIRQGRLQFVGGGFSMSDEATTSYHAVIDMLTYSLEKINSTFLECGRPLVSWQSDVFGHSREFAALMAQMAYGGHFISPISYDDEVSRMINKSMEFVWRGSDDLGPYTDLYTHKLFDGYWSPPGFCFGSYCEDQPIVENEDSFKNVEEKVKQFIDSAIHRQAPYYMTKNVMVIMGQRFGYFDAGVWFANIDKLIRNVNVRSGKMKQPVKLFYSSPACYLKAVSQVNPQFTTKQDDFLPFAYDQISMAVGMYTSRPTVKYLIRQGHVYLQIAKQLQMTARLHAKHFDAILDRFKWINGIMQDHNIITGVMTEPTRLYYTHKMFLGLQESTTVDMAAFNKLRKSGDRTEYFRCAFNISLCQNTDAEQYFIVIYNPLAWPVTVNVRLPTLKRDFIVFHPSGKRVRAAIMKIANPVLTIYRQRTHAKHELVFIAEDIPPVGFRSYFIKLKSRREKRSILKKVNKKHKTKKYLVKQAYQNGLTDDGPKDFGNFDYEYFEGPVRTTPKTKIQFGSVDSDSENTDQNNDNSVVTPKARLQSDDNSANKSVNAAKKHPFNDFSDESDFSVESNETDSVDKLISDINEKNVEDGRRGNFNKNMSLNKMNDDSRQNLIVNETKVISIEPRKMNKSMIDKDKEVFRNVINRTRLNKDDFELVREFYRKNENKFYVKNVVTHDNASIASAKDIFSEEDTMPDIVIGPKDNLNKNKVDGIAKNDENIETTTKDIFSETDTDPDILGPKNIFNKKKVDNITRYEIDQNSEEIVTTTKDIFSETDTDPDIILGPKNVFNRKKGDNITRYEIDQNSKEFVTTTKDIFSETDTDPDIILGPKNVFNKKKVDNITRYEIDQNSKENVTTKDTFSEVDTGPDIVLGPKNTSHKKKINKTAFIEKLKKKEYEEIGISESNENKNTTKISFENDDDIWIGDKFKTPANKTFTKQNWEYISDDNARYNKSSNVTNKLLPENAIDLKDSDFSDTDMLKTGNNSRKSFSIFGSDDDQIRRHMFGSDGAKSQNEKPGGEYGKLVNEKFGGEFEKLGSDKSGGEFEKLGSDKSGGEFEKLGSDKSGGEYGKLGSDKSGGEYGKLGNEKFGGKLGSEKSSDEHEKLGGTEFGKLPEKMGSDDDTTKAQSSDDEKLKVSQTNSTTRKRVKTDREWDSYHYYISDDLFISNRYVLIQIDEQNRLTNITLSNRVNITFNVEMFYYMSDHPEKFRRGHSERPPGISMFRTLDPRALIINDNYKASVFKSRMVQELHYEFSSYASFVIRLYRLDPVIELEWQVGPVPVEDGFGKEIFIRYTTNLKHDGTFYTDSNGRQTIKRIRNRRYSYEPLNHDYLAGNIYPVTSKIYIEDERKNIRFTVFNDRSQGGTSLCDGEIDLFLHRRILTDDTNRGYLILNETEHKQGIKVRGKHYIYLTKADSKPNRIFEKKLSKEIELAPQIFVTKSGPYGLSSKSIWMQQKNEYSALKAKLPIGVHLLTLEKWGEDGDDLLLRLENYLERSDALMKGIKRINLKDLFVDIRITSIREMTLGANMWRSSASRDKFFWNKKNEFYKSFNRAYGDSEKEYDQRKPRKFVEEVNLNEDIVLVPQQIRTFFVTYEYIGEL